MNATKQHDLVHLHMTPKAAEILKAIIGAITAGPSTTKTQLTLGHSPYTTTKAGGAIQYTTDELMDVIGVAYTALKSAL